MNSRYLWVAFLLCLGVVFHAELAPAEVKSDFGADFRLRQEFIAKSIDLRTLGLSDMDYFRLRSSLWGKLDLREDLGAYLKVTNEAKYYLGSYKPFVTSDKTSDDNRFDADELIVDNLYVDAKNIAGLPIDIRIGRQNLYGLYGEGFVIMDGTPGDGSRTIYFNAVKATLRFSKDNSLDLLYISDPKTDAYLPSLYPARSNSLSGYSENKRLLNASNEMAFVAYGKGRITEQIALEPYYIYKEEDPVGTNTKLRLNTVGARSVLTLGEWKLRGEFAHQFGEYENKRDREANGGYVFFGRTHNTVSLKPEWELGYIYLSGDDPKTAKHEGWDPLFSRAPMWNELYVYTLLLETSKDSGPIPGYWTNLHIYNAGVKLAFSAATKLALAYQYLMSDSTTAGLPTVMFSNNSRDRGHMGVAVLNHSFTKKIEGLLQAEYFIPGKFYAGSATDAILLRWQLQFKF